MVLGLFSKEGALKRAMKTAQNKLAQSEDRMAALRKLADAGTDEALLALCKRFSFVYDKSIQDIDEKDWVVATLAQKGEVALAPLATYMKTASSLGYPLMVLGRIAKPDVILKAIDTVLADEKPGYTRDPKRRIDVIEWLAEWDGASDEDIAHRIMPYLFDFDENVRFKAIEAISQKPINAAAEPLCKAILNPEEESARIRQRAAEVLADKQMDLGDHLPAISEMLDSKLSGFRLHRDRLQKK
jgi:HEAT repeat protein